MIRRQKLTKIIYKKTLKINYIQVKKLKKKGNIM